MKQVPLIFLSLLIGHFSCRQVPTPNAKTSLKDSLLKDYFITVDSLSYYDTTTVDFKLLKAHRQNDITLLKKLLAYIKGFHLKSQWQLNLDSCVTQEQFKNIKAEEAYRFNYSPSFCPYVTSLTAVRYKDSAVLRTLVYQYAWNENPCKIIEQSSKSLDSLEWENLQYSIQIGDLWGLKQDNGRHGYDGSTLEIYGYQKGNSSWNPDKSTFVSRWSPGPSSIFECFNLLLKLSKTKNGCITVR